MTVHAFMDLGDPLRIDLDNKIDPTNGVRYIGHAWFDLVSGRWLCLADVGALCVVEVRLVDGASPTSDPKETMLP